MDVIFSELLKALGRFFAHPLTYIIPVAMFILGILRVKRERQSFLIRTHRAWFDVTAPLLPGMFAGGILSLIILAFGFVFPFSFFLIVSGWILLFLILGRTELLSSAYTVGLAGLSLFLFPLLQMEWLEAWGEGVVDGRFLLLFLAVLLLIEGVLIWTNGTKHTSPFLVKSPRGKFVGAHRLQRIWFVPLFFLVPGGEVSTWDWSLLLPTSIENVSFYFVPFAMGVKQNVFHTLPQKAISQTGKRIVILSIIVGILAGFSYLEERLVPFALIVAIVARAAISMYNKWKEKESTPFFTLPPTGIRVLDVLPESTAEKIGITPGEIIVKANGQTILHERDLYEGIQRNPAYCKLEVKDIRGEVRHVQSAVYANEHHELGILFVSDRDRKETVQVMDHV